MSVAFKNNEQGLTLGAELEFQVLDRASGQLTPRASEIMDQMKSKKLIHEFFQSTLEVITGVCHGVNEVDKDFSESIEQVKKTSNALGLQLASTGTHPQADYRDRIVTDKARYKDLVDRNQWLVLRRAVYGMHIHLGMKTGDECMAFNNFFLHFVPHLIALSASSPFWQKYDTGLAACRLTMYEAMPTAGIPYLVKDWKEFQKLVKFLMRSDSIRSLKDLWWDIRPSPSIGTLELRMCDVPSTYRETLSIIAFAHSLAHWFEDHRQEWIKANPSLKHWIYRENKWRAIRYGLDATIIKTRTGFTKPLREDISEWMDKLEPYFNTLDYHKHIPLLSKLLERGNSAQRQRRIYEQSHDLLEVVRFNIREFEKGEPIWS
jgi:carboxylate-amine ligase